MPQHVTVEEAKEIWCRHGRQFCYQYKDVNCKAGAGVAVGAAALNRNSSDKPETKCYGNDCMAWAWFDPEEIDIAERKGFCGAETW